MTRKAAIELLKNTKIYVNGKSAQIQKKLFELGFEWPGAIDETINTYCPFLYISDKYLSAGDNMEDFVNDKRTEISAEEISNIEIIPEFKENDILTAGWESENDSAKWVFIYKNYSDGKYLEKAALMLKGGYGNSIVTFNDYCTAQKWIRPATEGEKYALFNALIESSDIRAKSVLKEAFSVIKFNTFEEVLVRNNDTESWQPRLFGKLSGNPARPYLDIYYNAYKYCIPYKGNESLVYKTK